MQKTRLGIVGLGSMGKIHLHNSMKMPSCQVTAVADKSTSALKYAREMGVKKGYKDYNKLFEKEDLDAVIISLPNFLHLDSTIKAAENDINVLLEKPIARNSEEGEKILSKVRSSGIKLMMGYPLRFSPDIQNVSNRIIDGSLGDIIVAIGTNISGGPFTGRSADGRPVPVPDWWFDKDLIGGGVLLDIGIHHLNLFNHFFGEVKEIDCDLGYRYNMEFEDQAILFLKYVCGTNAIVNVGWFSEDFKTNLELYGTVGNIIMPSEDPSPFVKVFRGIKNKIGFANEKKNSFYNEVDYFSYCIGADENPVPSGEEGLNDINIIQKAYDKASLTIK